MNTSALITIILVWGTVITITVYLFYKVLFPKKQKNDEE